MNIAFVRVQVPSRVQTKKRPFRILRNGFFVFRARSAGASGLENGKRERSEAFSLFVIPPPFTSCSAYAEQNTVPDFEGYFVLRSLNGTFSSVHFKSDSFKFFDQKCNFMFSNVDE